MNTDPRCVLVLVHGLGAHGGRWEAMADFFLNKGIPSYAVNLPNLSSVSSFYSEILRIHDVAAKENPGRKLFLAGESLGGLVSFLFAAEHPELFDGLVCISPAFASRRAIGLLQAAKMLFPILYDPSRQVKLPFDSSMCTRDEGYRKNMDADPLEHRSISMALVFGILMAQRLARSVVKKIRSSVLFLVAGEDLVVDAGVSRKIFDGLEVKDKKFMEFAGMYHSLSIDLGKEAVFEALYKWVKDRS